MKITKNEIKNYNLIIKIFEKKNDKKNILNSL